MGTLQIKLQSFNRFQLQLTLFRLHKIFQVKKYKINTPIFLPTKKRIYCVLRSPHVNKNSREHFEIRRYSYLLEIKAVKHPNLKFYLPTGVGISFFLKN